MDVARRCSDSWVGRPGGFVPIRDKNFANAVSCIRCNITGPKMTFNIHKNPPAQLRYVCISRALTYRSRGRHRLSASPHNAQNWLFLTKPKSNLTFTAIQMHILLLFLQYLIFQLSIPGIVKLFFSHIDNFLITYCI